MFAKAAGECRTSLGNDFDLTQIPESTKETCRNWFYKVASIRELLPRFYVEAAILKSLLFLAPEEVNPALVRLALMCRGIADPLVASFARAYLCRVARLITVEIQNLADLPIFVRNLILIRFRNNF